MLVDAFPHSDGGAFMNIEFDSFVDRLSAAAFLDETSRNAIRGSFSDVLTVGSNAEILSQDSGQASLHVLLEGWAYRYDLLPDGKRHISALYLPGDLCDVDGLHARPIDRGIAALTVCRVARLSRAAVLAAMDEFPQVTKAFLHLAINETLVLARWNRLLGFQTAHERMAHLFCELFCRLKVTAETVREGDIELPLSQSELADVLGLSAVHVNRVLQDLRHDKMVRVAKGRLHVLDWERLAALARFEPDYIPR
jgi:CRP-like cAMP-binding protein